MSAIVTYVFENLPVRTALRDGEPWFVAADVAEILGYAEAKDMTRNLDEDEKGRQTLPTPGGAQEMNVVSESGLYSAILTSRKAEAKRFKKWVTSEVLPSIRRTGSYTVPVPQTLPEALRLAANLAEQKAAAEVERDQAIATKALIGHKREATAMARASAAMRRADRLQRELGRHHTHATVLAVENVTGTWYAWLPLRNWCRANSATPEVAQDARYGEVKSWPAAARQAVHGVDLAVLFDVHFNRPMGTA